MIRRRILGTITDSEGMLITGRREIRPAEAALLCDSLVDDCCGEFMYEFMRVQSQHVFFIMSLPRIFSYRFVLL